VETGRDTERQKATASRRHRPKPAKYLPESDKAEVRKADMIPCLATM
jgi:hypothetical protein